MTQPKTNKWGPGVTGNPKGRPKGTGEVAKLRAAIGKDVPGLLQMLMAQALAGNLGAARLILDRLLPPLRAVEQAQVLNLPDGTLTEQAKAVLAEVSAGRLAPGQGAALLGGIATMARVAEVDELAARIGRLEKAHGTTS